MPVKIWSVAVGGVGHKPVGRQRMPQRVMLRSLIKIS